MTSVDNPLLQPWSTPFGVPPFEAIRPEHYTPAFEAGFAAHKAEIAAIAADPEPASFANTIAAMERSGTLLDRVARCFFILTGSHTNPDLQAIERDIAPRMAKHGSDISLNADLFARIDALMERIDGLGLTDEERRVLTLTHRDFVRSGAKLVGADRDRFAAIGERLAVLGTQFGQNVLADEAGWTLVLETEDDRAGLPEWYLAAATQAGRDLNLGDKPVVTLGRSSVEPFLEFSTNRALRERVFQAWIHRGQGQPKTDNAAIVTEMLALRAEKAALLGYATYAAYALDRTMAQTPDAADALMMAMWRPATAQARREAEALQALVAKDGDNFTLAPHDWRFYANRLRVRLHELDEAEIKPYLSLDRMIEAAFDVATRLFGIRFEPRTDVPVYHPDVRCWEVLDRAGQHLALFMGDYYARPSKRSGAWMTEFRSQHNLDGRVRPLVLNVMNFNKGAPGQPSLLSLTEARTLFHEFGHGLHGMLSAVTYPSISGTSVPRDFVEFPSQLYEHWLMRPEVLSRHALHVETGEPIPATLIDKVKAADNFNQGFATTEFVGSALLDMAFHTLPTEQVKDPFAFEAAYVARIGMPEAIVLRHRTPHFQHIFSGGYAAGYYSYLWSAVLDSDGFAAFKEAGDVFDAQTAERLERYVYSAGGLRDPAEAYRAFRGRDPDPSALMKDRGFAEAG